MTEQTITALYDHFDNAHKAVNALMKEGFPHHAISLIAQDTGTTIPVNSVGVARVERKEGIPMPANTAEAASMGVGMGAALGGAGGLLLGLGAFTVPGIGPVLAAGPLVTALVGAGTGAATGGFLGALTYLGIADDDAHIYAEGVRRGAALLCLRLEVDQAARALDVLNRYEPVDVKTRSQTWRSAGWQRFSETTPPPSEVAVGRFESEGGRPPNVSPVHPQPTQAAAAQPRDEDDTLGAKPRRP